MQSYGSTTPGGPLNVRAIPFPIGKGVPHVAPRPAPTPRSPFKKTTPSARHSVESALGARLVAAYREGEPAKDITARLGVSRTTLYDALKSAGVPTRRASS